MKFYAHISISISASEGQEDLNSLFLVIGDNTSVPYHHYGIQNK